LWHVWIASTEDVQLSRKQIVLAIYGYNGKTEEIQLTPLDEELITKNSLLPEVKQN
jgi:hypothetical protein